LSRGHLVADAFDFDASRPGNLAMRLINLRPSRNVGRLLGLLPFVLTAVLYVMASSVRRADNPDDKLLPAFPAFLEAIKRMALTEDPRTGEYLFWFDTGASLGRLGVALAIATAIALFFGMAIGLLPYMRSLLASFTAAISMVPPLAILPILFITVGLGEAAKIVLIVIGITPALIRDIALRIEDLPPQQFVKAQTLGASTWTIALRVVLPQILPRLVDALRLQLGPAWLFLIAAEAIASESGLGYRIFLVRRYLAMDVILPYVAWITLLAFLMEIALLAVQRRAFPWFAAARASA
jgi:NitT/TauT family transport system permease protein